MSPFELASGDSVEVPRTTIALVQNEAETLRTPNRDLRGMFLGSEERWHVEAFGERSFRAALTNTELYDGLVLGYNAIHESQDLKAALLRESPSCHMLILHQYALDCLEFLRGEAALCSRELGPVTGCATPPAELAEDEEVLLNWPHRVLPMSVGGCQALRYFSFRPDSSWRVVLEVESQRRRFPVLIRTAATSPLRIVACSLLLDVQNAIHRRLLENLLTYCTLGRPRIAVLDSPDPASGYVAAQFAAKLRLQGASTMVIRPGEGGVRVGDWPLKVADRMVVPAASAASAAKPNPASQPNDPQERENAERWRKSGGAIVEIRADGTATVHMEMDDTHAIARRWATWFHGAPEDSWAKRTFQLRAVLRMLKAIDRQQQGTLELRASETYAGIARELLAPRVAAGNLEETIGTTAAAYDIDAMVGSCLPGQPGKSRKSLAKWLREQIEREQGRALVQRLETPLEERLDVARALADAELLARVLVSIRAEEPLGATVVIRLREAAVACRAGLATWKAALLGIDSTRLSGAELAHELDGRLLASAEFVAAAAAFKQALAGEQELSAYTEHALDDEPALVAVATLARIGSLAQGQAQGQRSAQEVSAEALALHRYMGSDKSSTFQIWPQATEIPAKAVESLLGELAAARERRDTAEKDRSSLGLSVPISAGIALGTIGAVLLGQSDRHRGLHVSWSLAIFGWVVPPLALLGIWMLLDRRDREHRDMRVARHALTVLSLLVAIVVALLLTRHVVGFGAFGVAVVFLLLASLATGLLDRIGLAAPWAAYLLDTITSPTDTAAKLRRSLPGARGREEKAAASSGSKGA